MYLTKDEEKMLSGEFGEGYRRAIEILVKLGDYYDAKRMVPVSWAMLVIGTDSPEKDLTKWLEEFADLGVTFRCPLTLAQISQIERSDVDRRMGAQFTWGGGGDPTNLFPLPVYGQYIMGGGTNVTTYCNGIIGARANSEGPAGIYMGAIVGKTPEYGYLLPENRIGKTLFEVKAKLENYTDWDALGFCISETLSTHWWDVPVLTGIKPAATSTEDLISFCSTIASVGSCNHFLIEGISPEARTLDEAFGGEKPKEKFLVGPKEMKEVYDRFPPVAKKPDFVQLYGGAGGSTGLENLYRIAKMVEGKKVSKNVPLYVGLGTGPARNIADRVGLTKILEDAGAQLGPISWNGKRINLWTEAKREGVKVVVTDSAKNCHYMAQQEVDAVLMPIEKCVEVALAGKIEV